MYPRLLFVIITLGLIFYLAEVKRDNSGSFFFSQPVHLTNAPADGETCFSPIEQCDQKLISLIDSAQESLDIAIYDINLDELVHRILAQSKKIRVRIIVDKMQAKGSHSLVNTLIKGGANLKYGHQRGIMHNKFTIADGKMIETGSFNYTNHATKANNENQLYIANPSVIKRYQERFEQIWSEAVIPSEQLEKRK